VRVPLTRLEVAPGLNATEFHGSWYLGRLAAEALTTEDVPSAEMSVDRDTPDDTSVVERDMPVAVSVPAPAAVLQRDALVPEPIGAVPPLPGMHAGMVAGEPPKENVLELLEESLLEERASDVQRLAEGELRG